MDSDDASVRSEEEEETVLRIDADRMRRGKKEYLVVWSQSQPSWQSREDLVDPDGTECMALIRYEIRLDMEQDAKKDSPREVTNNNRSSIANNNHSIASPLPDKHAADLHVLMPGTTGIRCRKCLDLQLARPLLCNSCHHYIKAHGYDFLEKSIFILTL